MFFSQGIAEIYSNIDSQSYFQTRSALVRASKQMGAFADLSSCQQIPVLNIWPSQYLTKGFREAGFSVRQESPLLARVELPVPEQETCKVWEPQPNQVLKNPW